MQMSSRERQREDGINVITHTYRICQVVSNIIKSINSVLYIKIIQNSSQWFSLNSPLSQTTTTHVLSYIPATELCRSAKFNCSFINICRKLLIVSLRIIFVSFSTISSLQPGFFMIMLSSLSINMKHLWIMLKVLSKFA